METPFPTLLSARFEVLEAFAETPFERSFRAHDQVLQRDVLLKLPARDAWLGWSAPIKERLLREARSLAKIRHENVAPIHWIEETADGPLLVLDLPEGELLAERLRRGPLEVDATIDLGIQLAAALAHVHFHGVVHRAVGPSTVRLLANGRVQLGSFTFAKEFGVRGQASSLAHARRGEAEVARFLPDYSAPEQIAGQAADPRADVFALGCTLFRCLAGRDPFPPGHDQEPMPDLRALRKEVGKPLAEVIRKCTLHGRTARYATAQEVVDALKALRVDAGSSGGSKRLRIATIAGAACLGVVVFMTPALWPAAKGSGPPSTVEVVEDRRYQDTYGPDYDKLYGLLIGIGEGYAGTSLGGLTNPVREIEAVHNQLCANDPKWKEPNAIKMLPDKKATLAEILHELECIKRKAKSEDAVLVYFSGHGIKKGRSFGLAAQDAAGTDIEAGTGYLRREVLNTFLDECKAKHVLVILDCCHSGAVFESGTIGKGKGRGVDGRDANPGDHHRKNFSREFLCSASANEKASDGTDLSPFCKLLLDQLRQLATAERQYVAARFLSAHIEEVMDQKVSRLGTMQVPKFRQMSEQEGSFVFRLAPK